MSCPWEADPEVYTMIQDLITNHFPLSKGLDDQILVVFKEKASVSGGSVAALARDAVGFTVSNSGDISFARREGAVSPDVLLLGDKYRLAITLVRDDWERLTDVQRRDLLLGYLSDCVALADWC